MPPHGFSRYTRSVFRPVPSRPQVTPTDQGDMQALHPDAGWPKAAWAKRFSSLLSLTQSQQPYDSFFVEFYPSLLVYHLLLVTTAASGTFDPLCKVLFALRTVYLCAIEHTSVFVLPRDTPRRNGFSTCTPKQVYSALLSLCVFLLKKTQPHTDKQPLRVTGITRPQTTNGRGAHRGASPWFTPQIRTPTAMRTSHTRARKTGAPDVLLRSGGGLSPSVALHSRKLKEVRCVEEGQVTLSTRGDPPNGAGGLGVGERGCERERVSRLHTARRFPSFLPSLVRVGVRYCIAFCQFRHQALLSLTPRKHTHTECGMFLANRVIA